MARKINFEDMGFAAALAGYVTSGATHKQYAAVCADRALTHFAEHGDTTYLTKFAKAMKETATMRRSAFIKWATENAPLKLENNKFVQDNERGKHEDLLKEGQDAEGNVVTPLSLALRVPFWEYAPEEQIVNYGAQDVKKALNQLVKRFTNEGRSHLDRAAQEEITALKNFIAVRENGAEAQA